MTILNQNDSILLVIDVQEKLINAVFNPETIKKNAQILAKASSLLGLPIVITEQYPKGLGNTIEGINGDKYFEKTSFDALSEEAVLEELKNSERKQVIVLGIETHICVHQTVAGLIDKGFDVTVVSDACSSRREESYQIGIDCMKSNGAQIKSIMARTISGYPPKRTAAMDSPLLLGSVMIVSA